LPEPLIERVHLTAAARRQTIQAVITSVLDSANGYMERLTVICMKFEGVTY
jgi:hypothetical protein